VADAWNPEVMDRSPTGVLIIRCWVEDGSAHVLRAHIRYTTDVATDVRRSVTLTTTEAAIRTVQSWLHDMLTASSRRR
jgi:hypothetical protein